MTFRVVIETEAERELAEAVDWYNHQRSGLGRRFAQKINQALLSISQAPERSRPAGRRARRVRVVGWPYTIFFAIRNRSQEVVVIGVFHNRREPSQIQRRLHE